MARLIDADELILTILTHDLCDTEQVDKDILEAPTVEAIPISFIKDCITKGDDWTFDKDTLWHLIETWEKKK